jgi:diacylglycerol kinase family enzyme
MSSPTTLIVNGSAGSLEGDPSVTRLRDAIKTQGLDWDLALTRNGPEISARARAAVQAGAATVVAVGGDGTVSAIASELAGTDAVLGVLPLGTLNHFAKDLSIPLELAAAVETIIKGRRIRVDIGEVNGRTFINNSSLGIYPRIIDQRAAEQRSGRTKWLAHASAAMQTLQSYPLWRVRLDENGRTLGYKTPVVFIGNNAYDVQGLNFGSRKTLQAGSLCVYVLHDTGPLGIVRFAASALLGTEWSQARFDALCTKEVCIETPRRRERVALDGEVYTLTTPLRYRIQPGALNVWVPVPAQNQP